MHVVDSHTEALRVDSTSDSLQDTAYMQYSKPVRTFIAQEMSIQIGYLADTLWVAKPECPMLNWASDALLAQARKKSGRHVDMAVVNIGGMRDDWHPGALTLGHIYELMPFDNWLVLLTMKGQDILDLCEGFARRGGEGVAGLRMTAVGGHLAECLIDGKAVEPERQYIVATSNYLAGGADKMFELQRYSERLDSDLLIRDLYIQAIQESDTIHAVMDGRVQLL